MLTAVTHYAHRLLTEHKYISHLAILIILADAVLTQLIVHLVPYTEIDWETYMVHIQLYLKGERDYANITGPTGPLVYPAGHLHIHHVLYWLTNSGQHIRLAQHIYAAIYIISLTLMCCIYSRAGNVPNSILFLLPLSKRLHSIYVLRLFNDCWSVVAVQAAVLSFQYGMNGLGTLLFSLALSVKMSVLLYLPGLAVIFFLTEGLWSTFQRLGNIVAIQVLLAYPFLKHNPSSYLHYAFDFSRVFLYKWTVNWRFLPEHTFLSSELARGLLVGHLGTLVCFGALRWLSNQGGLVNTITRGLRRPEIAPAWVALSPDYIATILFTCNLIGILFARSLHYQFYSWYFQQLPFLAWRTRFYLPLKLGLIFAAEYSWNTFPSTTLSSGVLLAIHAFLLYGIWSGYPVGKSHSKSSNETK